MAMIKIALIGLGKIGMSHCAIINAHAGVDFVGAADTSKLLRWGLEKYSPIPVFDDYKEMISETKPQGVVIATPTRTHFEIASYCLERGINVFVEKPCCLSYLETSQLRELAGQNSLLVQIGYHNRYIGTFKEARRLVQTGEIGEVYHFSADASGPVVIQEKEETWRSQRSEGGGCLYDYSSHVINLVDFVLGDIAEVRGTRLQNVFSKNVEDAVFSTLILRTGEAGQLTVSWSEESFRKMTTSLIISGRKGRIEVDSQELKLFRNSNHEEESLRGWNSGYLTDHTEPVDYYLRGEEYSAQIDDFVSSIAAESTDSINSIQKSGETDRIVALLIQDNERSYEALPELRAVESGPSDNGIAQRLKRLLPKGT